MTTFFDNFLLNKFIYISLSVFGSGTSVKKGLRGKPPVVAEVVIDDELIPQDEELNSWLSSFVKPSQQNKWWQGVASEKGKVR